MKDPQPRIPRSAGAPVGESRPDHRVSHPQGMHGRERIGNEGHIPSMQRELPRQLMSADLNRRVPVMGGAEDELWNHGLTGSQIRRIDQATAVSWPRQTMTVAGVASP